MSLVTGSYFISNLGTSTYAGLGLASGLTPVVNTNDMIPTTPVSVSHSLCCTQADADTLTDSSTLWKTPGLKTDIPYLSVKGMW